MSLTTKQQQRLHAFCKASMAMRVASCLAFSDAGRVNVLLQRIVLNPGTDFDVADLALDIDGTNTLAMRANERATELDDAFVAMIEALRNP